MDQTEIERTYARAERATDAQRWDEARAGYLQVLRHQPKHADALLQLSYLDSFAGHYRSAQEWALRAADAGLPVRPQAQIELIRRLRTFNETLCLRQSVERMIDDPSTPVGVLVEATVQLSNLNDFDAALHCAQATVQKEPGHPSGRLVYGQMLVHFGRFPEAEPLLEDVLRRTPEIAAGWWMLARLRKQTPDSNHVAMIQNQLRRPGLPAENGALLARALHKELDDLGDYEGAWKALELMCRLRRAGSRYRSGHTRELFGVLMARKPTPMPSEVFVNKPIPIFVIGMHRSGTTLLEQLLSAGPQVKGLGELADFTSALRYMADHYCRDVVDAAIVARSGGADAMTLVGKRYLDGLAWRLDGVSYFSDKRPSNFLNAGFICDALPQAKLVHLVRDPMETCFSNLRELFTDINAYSYDQAELADYYQQYRQLMRHWHITYPGRILDVSYARLLSDTEAVMREVATFCGLEYERGMSSTATNDRPVSTASSIQVRQGIESRSTPKWEPYRTHLQPLITALSDLN